jgi:hypothetical protein
MEVMDTVKLD